MMFIHDDLQTYRQRIAQLSELLAEIDSFLEPAEPSDLSTIKYDRECINELREKIRKVLSK